MRRAYGDALKEKGHSKTVLYAIFSQCAIAFVFAAQNYRVMSRPIAVRRLMRVSPDYA